MRRPAEPKPSPQAERADARAPGPGRADQAGSSWISQRAWFGESRPPVRHSPKPQDEIGRPNSHDVPALFSSPADARVRADGSVRPGVDRGGWRPGGTIRGWSRGQSTGAGPDATEYAGSACGVPVAERARRQGAVGEDPPIDWSVTLRCEEYRQGHALVDQANARTRRAPAQVSGQGPERPLIAQQASCLCSDIGVGTGLRQPFRRSAQMGARQAWLTPTSPRPPPADAGAEAISQ